MLNDIEFKHIMTYCCFLAFMYDHIDDRSIQSDINAKTYCCLCISRLTAYVIKSFSQAAKFVFIDKDHVMRRAISWIIKQQKTGGRFVEPGKVLEKAMQVFYRDT